MKNVKTRKEHICELCDIKIKKGDICIFEKGREPVYDVDGWQIGIEYWHAWICRDHYNDEKEFGVLKIGS